METYEDALDLAFKAGQQEGLKLQQQGCSLEDYVYLGVEPLARKWLQSKNSPLQHNDWRKVTDSVPTSIHLNQKLKESFTKGFASNWQVLANPVTAPY